MHIETYALYCFLLSSLYFHAAENKTYTGNGGPDQIALEQPRNSCNYENTSITRSVQVYDIPKPLVKSHHPYDVPNPLTQSLVLSSNNGESIGSSEQLLSMEGVSALVKFSIPVI